MRDKMKELNKNNKLRISKSKEYQQVALKMQELKMYKGNITNFVLNELKIKNKNTKPYKEAFELLEEQGWVISLTGVRVWQDVDGMGEFLSSKQIHLVSESILKNIKNKPVELLDIREFLNKSIIELANNKEFTEEINRGTIRGAKRTKKGKFIIDNII